MSFPQRRNIESGLAAFERAQPQIKGHQRMEFAMRSLEFDTVPTFLFQEPTAHNTTLTLSSLFDFGPQSLAN